MQEKNTSIFKIIYIKYKTREIKKEIVIIYSRN